LQSDCTLLNILQDPTALFPRGFHPVNYCLNPASDGLAYNAVTRTACWPRYYLIDFGRSRRYEPAGGPPRERDEGKEGKGTECNPFPADICDLGNLLKRHFIRSDPSCTVRWLYYLPP
jgi:hypothetical protein